MALQLVGQKYGGIYSTAASYNIDLTTLTGGIDTHPSEGDIVIAIVGAGSETNLSIGVNTTGYTELAELHSNDTYDSNLSANYKIMGSTPDTSINITGTGDSDFSSFTVIQVWRGVDLTNPIDVATITATGTNTIRGQSGAITPITSGALVISAIVGACTNSESETAPFTAPTGYSNTYGAQSNNTYATVTYIASKVWSGSGAETPSAWGSAADNYDYSWCAVTIALRPAISGPANLKSYNTNQLSNIKTINTNPIANCKSLNTNI